MDLKAIITQPHQTGTSPDNLLKGQLLWMLLLRVILYTLLLGISVFLQSDQLEIILPPYYWLLSFICCVYLSTIGSAFFLLTSKKELYHFAFLQNQLDIFLVTLLVYYTGSSLSAFSPLYFFPIIAGGLILPRKGGLVAAAAATLQFGLVLGLEQMRITPAFLNRYEFFKEQNLLTSINHFAVLGLTFFLAAILSAIFARRLLKTEAALSDTVRSFDSLSLLYKQIFDDIATGIITIDNNNRITSANNAIARITGYSPTVLPGQVLFQVFPTLDLDNKGSRLTADLLRQDGVEIRVGYSCAKLQLPVDTELHEHKKPQCQNCRVLTIQDISEVERLEQQMRQAEKLAAIGRISAGIAHDFRNPLTAISGSAQILINEFSLHNSPEQRTNRALINIILRESNRLSHTISDFLKFAKPETTEREWFSLKKCLDEVLQVSQADPLWPASCTLQIKVDPRYSLWADQHQIFTILIHLIQNALAFCPHGAELIKIEAEELNVSENQGEIILQVGDNGKGIEEENREKIFEPFFTRRVDGTGLGLAIVKQIVMAHHGTIEVGKSEFGGALFTVHLPLP
ncbi:MAG: PAS domain S-box protein [Proteobacteria bacterium]|jgi:two-component system sensor histidine kinase PilS (NtrC family)|nr:PAS domain S-box protein [Desulfocapsa sp.]MBU3944233.1 PAS domain S-box protein [Pseudomonadota bacterium]MCG2743788.1 ATP-binding protein [Desulfobacteraceae bacterium]MBU3983164.1 PAS domain S-box protein [Pseudomonadota bacterium]MBU4028834.1 PAS domain S-box protein [Pseudomonadota bacterium]